MVPRQTTTRERLITTAAELFWRQGYAQTGVNEIIQQAGSTSGSFYHFFPAKEDLVLAVIDRIEGHFEAVIFSPAVAGTDDPVEGVLAILDTYRANLRDNDLSLGSPMGVLAAEMSETHPRVRMRIANLFSSWVHRIEELLYAAGEDLPGNFDRTALASMIVSTIEGAVLQSRVEQGLQPLDAAIGHLRSYLLLLQGRDDVPTTLPATSQPISKHTATADWKAW